MNAVFALAGVVLKELYRRKDVYVLFALTAVITLILAAMNLFHDDKIVRYIKDIVLLLIWISALVIAIGTTARQLHAERENRTIFPLLAKPVSRAQVILGKFAGCWLACGLCLIVFYLFFAVVTGWREHTWPVQMYLQGFWLQWAMLGVVVGLVLFGSVVFTAPSSNATICFILVLGLHFLGGHLNQVALQQAEPLRTLIYTIYFLIPHLEWYDIRDLMIYDHNPVAWLDCLFAFVYACFYTSLFLFATWLVFRRKALNL
jgi:ABC-type transport system involved in multi-copper enzyme maturation permease subunit